MTTFLEAQAAAAAKADPLVHVQLPAGAADSISIGGVLYQADSNRLLSVPGSKVSAIQSHFPHAIVLPRHATP